MKKKTKTPLALRVIPAIFPWLEKLTPALANRFFAHLFFTPIEYPTPEKEKKAERFAEKFMILADGKQIQCYQWGNGSKTILVVHGWAGRATQFRRFVKPFLKEGFQIIGFDGPAHGKSDGRSTDVIEFKNTIKAIATRYENITGILAHSFGGIASLSAVAEGLSVNALVNIASPTLAGEIINTYLKALGGSVRTGEEFQKFVIRKYGQPFEDFSSLNFIKQVPKDFNLLLVHDEHDHEVSMKHPEELLKIFPQAKLLKTTGLGHTRILRDENVIREVVTFIKAHSSDS